MRESAGNVREKYLLGLEVCIVLSLGVSSEDFHISDLKWPRFLRAPILLLGGCLPGLYVRLTVS